MPVEASLPSLPSAPSIRVVLATHNEHKVAEFQAIVAEKLPSVEVVSYDGPEPIEDGVTFAENALIKARAAARHTGLIALADDSGVCVDVLGGAPGIFSARWSGRHGDADGNLQLLLSQLGDVRDSDRGAHFTSTIALVRPAAARADGRESVAAETVVEGIWAGELTREPRGHSGFGYDPIFLPHGSTRTAAELSATEKNAVSHRARAFELMIPALSALLVD